MSPARKKSASTRIKVGTILDKGLYASLKAQAGLESRSVSDVMEEALRRYVQPRRRTREEAEAFVRELCSNPALKMTEEELREIEELDEFEE